MDVLISLLVVIISQCILSHHLVYFKYILILLIYPYKHEKKKIRENPLKMQQVGFGYSADLSHYWELDTIMDVSVRQGITIPQ